MTTAYIVTERGYINNTIQEPGDTFYSANAELKGSWFVRKDAAEKKMDTMGVNELRALAEAKGVKVSEKDDKKTLKAKAKKAIEDAAKNDEEDEDIA
jgi:hypothetical protein